MLVTAALAASLVVFGNLAAAEPLIRDGDRIALVGATFIERMQNEGHFETALVSVWPEQRLVIRNLGWSGDTVFGRSRARFGSEQDGFKHLQQSLEVVKPSLIIAAYGNNEAYEGAAGLDRFRTGLDRLLDMFAATGARVVLLGTVRREPLAPWTSAALQYNRTLSDYDRVLAEAAERRGHPFISLAHLLPMASDAAFVPPTEHLTDNGLHLTPYGDWRIGPRLAEKLGAAPPRWEVEVDLATGRTSAVGAKLDRFNAKERSFTLRDERLPPPPLPPHSPVGAERHFPRSLRVAGLAAGKYDLLIDGEKTATFTADELAGGVTLHSGPEIAQAGELRAALRAKNELFFHRYRPQNETYLFLFRKHEQGNNAVEIPQFDPLIESQEKEIAELAKPRSWRYELRPPAP